MENLLKEEGNKFDLDMDVLLKKSMNSVAEDGNPSKTDEKAKKSSKKELKEESQKVMDLGSNSEKSDPDPQVVTSTLESVPEKVDKEMNTVTDSDPTDGDQEVIEETVAMDESTDVSTNERDECAEYKAQFFEDRPLTDKFIVVRVNDDLAQKIRVMLWRYPDLSTSAYVNNILQHHFREFRTVLETMAREVSESVIEVMS